MLAVAVRADRRFFNPRRNRLTMNAFFIDGCDVLMAAPAGVGIFVFVDAAGRIERPVQIMRPMTVTADRGRQISFGEGLAVNRVVVRTHRISLGQMRARHAFGIVVAVGASCRDVAAIHGGFGIPRIEKRVAVAVAILAGRRLGLSMCHGAAVIRIKIDLTFYAMAAGTGNRGRFPGMGNFDHIRMAGDTEILAVDRTAEGIFIDERSVSPLLAMAGQARAVIQRIRVKGERKKRPQDCNSEDAAQGNASFGPQDVWGPARGRNGAICRGGGCGAADIGNTVGDVVRRKFAFLSGHLALTLA